MIVHYKKTTAALISYNIAKYSLNLLRLNGKNKYNKELKFSNININLKNIWNMIYNKIKQDFFIYFSTK